MWGCPGFTWGDFIAAHDNSIPKRYAKTLADGRCVGNEFGKTADEAVEKGISA